MEAAKYIEARQRMVDEALRDFIHERFDDEMMEMVAYMATGGKRIRGVLALLACEAVGSPPEDALVAACALELAHAASLAKDDFMDGDSKRRGRPAAWVKYGAKLAMLTPDVILPHVLEFVSEYGLRALNSLNMAWGKLAFGQLLDYPRPGSMPLMPKEYERIIGLKTAPLFQVACSLGVRASRKDWFISVAEQYGHAVGMAFQVYDDASDLMQYRGRDWKDISGGKDLPMSMQALKTRVGGGGTITEADYSATLEMGQTYLAKAEEAALAFPDSEVKPVLQALPRFCCEALLAEGQEATVDYTEDANASRLLGVAL